MVPVTQLKRDMQAAKLICMQPNAIDAPPTGGHAPPTGGTQI